jgi:hypothetical protein
MATEILEREVAVSEAETPAARAPIDYDVLWRYEGPQRVSETELPLVHLVYAGAVTIATIIGAAYLSGINIFSN